MYVTLVYVQVKPEHVDDFKEATLEVAKESSNEPGNIRFDLLQSRQSPCHFVLYQGYESSDDAAAHKGSPHYLHWRDRVAGWMAAPRESADYEGLQPSHDFWVSDK
ncbi:MAG: antibiotic biosynthesis monooxygenase [Armatimonadota bacterium]|nr:antibiotic biosynthesis monooxygenase [bacterium]